MELNIIEIFLKNTVIGIIILGAIGSIIAFFIIKLCHYIFQYLYNYLYNKGIKAGYIKGFMLGAISVRKNPIEIHIYFLYQLVKFIIGIVFSLGFAALFLYVLSTKGAAILTVGTYMTIFIAFLSAIYTFNIFTDIRRDYKQLLSGLHESAEQIYVGKKTTPASEEKKENSVCQNIDFHSCLQWDTLIQ